MKKNKLKYPLTTVAPALTIPPIIIGPRDKAISLTQ